MRFDVNVSVSAQPGALGKRSEVKNLNSFRSVEAAIEYEIERQIDLLERGEPVEQETRGWDEAKQKTTMQRGKEEAHDYRYFPDPDLPPVELSDEYIKDIGASIPDLPKALREKFISLNLGSLEVETILDEPDAAEILVKTMQDMVPAASRTIANWLIGDIRRMVNEGEASWKGVSNVIQQLSELASMVAANKISSTAAKNILSEVVKSAVNPAEFAKTHGMLQVSDEAAIQKIVSEVIADNPKAAEDVARGEMKAIGFLVGQVMAKSKGQANPGVAQQIIKRQLGV
jgi:aspartyl-tRNA(Asn)/glutamyl-tRNA(Gln) amidotransferase subunit B